jgi:hypothetical protein
VGKMDKRTAERIVREAERQGIAAHATKVHGPSEPSPQLEGDGCPWVVRTDDGRHEVMTSWGEIFGADPGPLAAIAEEVMSRVNAAPGSCSCNYAPYDPTVERYSARWHREHMRHHLRRFPHSDARTRDNLRQLWLRAEDDRRVASS